jgi:DNA integrity scanning protein DisA with diadenylate cyclase activity
MVVTISILLTLLLILILVSISYTNHRISAGDRRHDLANKNFHCSVLVELSKIIEREKLDHLLIEATENASKKLN